MSRMPFYKRYPSDRLMGTRDLTLEERGAYDDLLDMMYDRGRPIPDEPRWIAGFLGVSVRKWTTIRASLLAAGKLIARGDCLSNPRFERELALEEAALTAQVEWGRMGGKKRAQIEKEARRLAGLEREPEFDLGDELSPPKSARKDAENELNREQDREINAAPPNKSNGLDQGSLKPARAFQKPESREKRDSPSSPRAKPKAVPKAKPRKKAKTTRALPKGWEPAPLTPEVADMVAVWPPGMMAREVAKFRDHAQANGRTAKDWDAALRNWLRKADDDWKRAGARAGGKPSAWGYASPRSAD